MFVVALIDLDLAFVSCGGVDFFFLFCFFRHIVWDGGLWDGNMDWNGSGSWVYDIAEICVWGLGRVHGGLDFLFVCFFPPPAVVDWMLRVGERRWVVACDDGNWGGLGVEYIPE